MVYEYMNKIVLISSNLHNAYENDSLFFSASTKSSQEFVVKKENVLINTLGHITPEYQPAGQTTLHYIHTFLYILQ